MVERLVRILGRKISGLHSAAYLLASFAILSQILGLIRDRLLAHYFGAGHILDIYYASFRVPDVIFVSVASVVSISVLIPFISSRLEDKKIARKFINDIFTVFFIAIVVISAIVFIFVPTIVRLVFPGFVGTGSFSEVVVLTRILLFSPILLGLSNLIGSITQTMRQFFVYALAPVLYNVGIIIGILFFYSSLGIVGLGLGVLLGAILHISIQIPAILKEGLVPEFTFRDIDWREIRGVVLTSLPRTLALSAHQLTLLFLVSIASLMVVGSISVFNFSFNLQSVPLSIIGVSFSLAAFPTLSRLYSSGDMDDFFKQIVEATRYIIFWSVPAIVLFVILRAHIVRVILGSGEFGWSETRLTAAALAIFVISLIGQGLNQLFTRGYYAAGNTKKPLVVNLVSSVTIVGLAFYFVDLINKSPFFRYFLEDILRVSGIEGTSILVLPLAFTAGLLLNGLLFWILFQTDFRRFSANLYRTVIQSISASVISGASTYLSLLYLGRYFDLDSLLDVFLHGFLSGIFGILIWLIVLYILDNRELAELYIDVKNKFWRSNAVAPEQESL